MLLFENSNHFEGKVTGFYQVTNAARAPEGTLSAQNVNATYLVSSAVMCTPLLKLASVTL